MPELPEVETIRRVLEPQIKGLTITAVTVSRSEVISRPAAEQFCRALTGQTIDTMTRRGKFLSVLLDTLMATGLSQMELYCGPTGQRRAGERRCCRRIGVPMRYIPRHLRLLSPEPAPNAGILPGIRELPRGAGSGHDHRPDTERGHSGGRINAPGAGAFGQAGGLDGQSWSSNECCPPGNCSRLHRPNALYWGEEQRYGVYRQ